MAKNDDYKAAASILDLPPEQAVEAIAILVKMANAHAPRGLWLRSGDDYTSDLINEKFDDVEAEGVSSRVAARLVLVVVGS